MEKVKIFIKWKRFERSQSFTGVMVGYISEDGMIGSFSENLLYEYRQIFQIIDDMMYT